MPWNTFSVTVSHYSLHGLLFIYYYYRVHAITWITAYIQTPEGMKAGWLTCSGHFTDRACSVFCTSCAQIMVMCMMSVLVSFLVKSGVCIAYPDSNKLHPFPPANDTSEHTYVYPNCTNYTATYTGLSTHTFAGNVYGLFAQIFFSYSLSTCCFTPFVR